jgi:hypothetical protein
MSRACVKNPIRRAICRILIVFVYWVTEPAQASDATPGAEPDDSIAESAGVSDDEAWSLGSKGELLMYGGHRLMRQAGFSEYDTLTESFTIFAPTAQAARGPWSAELRPELRWIESPAVGLLPQDISVVSARGPERWLDLRAELGRGSRRELFVELERAYFAYAGEELEASLGRRPFSPGVLRLFPVWNKFTRPLPTVQGPLLIYGQDHALVQAQRGPWQGRAAFLKGATPSLDVLWVEGVRYLESAELRALYAWWWEKRVFGAAAAFDRWETTFRFEGLLIGPDLAAGDPDRQTQLGLGVERGFGERLTLIVEGLWLSGGAADRSDYPLLPLSQFAPLRARAYATAQLGWQLTPFLNLRGGALVNLVDGSLLAQARAAYSLSEGLELEAEARVPLGTDGAEFSDRAFIFPDGLFVGVPSQFSVALRAFF